MKRMHRTTHVIWTNLLSNHIKTKKISVANFGWSGGPYGPEQSGPIEWPVLDLICFI